MHKDTVKSLRTKLKKNNEALSIEILEKQKIQAQINSIKLDNSILEKKLKKIQSHKNLVISEHAILRFLERVMEIDMIELKKKIINQEQYEKISTLGNGTYPINDHKVVIVDKKIVTIKI